MSLIIPRNLKSAKEQSAQDAQGDEVIAQKNGYKLVHNTLNDGYWFYTKSGAGWGITATNKVAAINEFNRLVGSAKDAAEFHVGQKVKHTRFGTIGKVFEIAPDGAIGVQWSNGQAYYGKFHMPLSEIVAVNE